MMADKEHSINFDSPEIDPNCMNPMQPLFSNSGMNVDKLSLTQLNSNTTINKPPEPFEKNVDVTMDIVRATQFGKCDLVMNMIESNNYGVNQMDKENVSLLHWAAINNRKDIAKYLINKGAIVDRIGGDLLSTPLHWATRQGNLQMVILLMQHGADPNCIDGEGCCCIHLAAQFGYTVILAFLISKGVDIDMVDKTGKTALMWVALRINSIQPVRLLITLNTNINQTDTSGNTALHYAAISGYTSVCSLLMKSGASLEIQNNDGKIPIQLAILKNNHSLEKAMQEHLSRKSTGKGGLKELIFDEKFQLKVAVVFPSIIMLLIGVIAELSIFIGVKILLYILLFFIVKKYSEHMITTKIMHKLPLYIYLATKLWMYSTWLFYFMPLIYSITVHISFFIMATFQMYNFIKAWKTDPGYIQLSIGERRQVLLGLTEYEQFDLDQFCTTCIIRKPIRSKHCFICDKCVAKFDHHCPWVDNCVGANNHKYFIGFLFWLSLMTGWCMYGAVVFWKNSCTVDYNLGVLISLSQIMSCSPWVFWIAINAFIHSLWVTSLFLCQFYQHVILAATTNERLNQGRYKHFHTHKAGTFKSPFNKGVIQNFCDLFDINFFGIIKPSKIDWKNVYLDKNKVIEM